MTLKAPFPYFGGKSTVAAEVWRRLGNPPNFLEPFFGSGAVLLLRPDEPGTETVNDLNGYVANFWRSIAQAPELAAEHADWPANENDLHARHAWLVAQKRSLRANLEGDPEWCDPKIAGWWCWGMSVWIGGGFCEGNGPWQVVDGQLLHLGNGLGVQRKRIHLSNKGRGIQRRRLHLGNKGVGIYDWFNALSARLERVRVTCGDWSRICGHSVTTAHGLTGVFLDPPYSADAGRDMDLYGDTDCGSVAHDVREWALEHGKSKLFRIALCGYEGEHEMPGWDCWEWKTPGGFGNQGNGRAKVNRRRERIWFSPHCVQAAQPMLF